MLAILIQIIIAIAVLVISYAMMPRPKTPKPQAASQMDGPQASAGMEIQVVFGEGMVKDPNCLWFGDRSQNTYKVDA